VKIYENFSISFQNSLVQDPMITYVQKCFFSKIWDFVLEMAVLERFWSKPLGVNPFDKKYILSIF